MFGVLYDFFLGLHCGYLLEIFYFFFLNRFLWTITCLQVFPVYTCFLAIF